MASQAKGALDGAHQRIAMLESNLAAEKKRWAHEHARAETNIAEAIRLAKEANELRIELGKVKRELEAAKGELQIATADRALAQRALSELVLRFCHR